MRIIRFFLYLFMLILYAGTEVMAACSVYTGRASINEVFKDRSNQRADNDDLIEIKILDTSLDQSIYESWSIEIQENNTGRNNSSDGATATTFSLSTFSGSLPWLVLDGSTIGRYINLKEGFNVILRDSSGDTIDYLSYDGYRSLEDSSCTQGTLPFDNYISGSGASFKLLERSPDGTGDWGGETSGSAPDTGTETNDDLVADAPDLAINSVSITPGDSAVLTLSVTGGDNGDGSYSQAIFIDYVTIDGTLAAGSDYTAVNATFTIPAGTTSINLDPIVTQSSAGKGEFYVLISNQASNAAANNANIIAAIGTVSINSVLVGEWRFEEDSWNGTSGEVADSSPNGLNGTAQNGVTTANTTPDPAIDGNPGTCRYGEFNGGDQHITVADNDALDLTESLTITAWVYTTSTGLQTIVSKSNRSGFDYNFKFQLGSGSTLLFQYFSGGFPRFVQTGSTSTISLNTWTHVAVTFEDGDQRFYINGVQATGGGSNTGTLQDNNGDVTIGTDLLFRFPLFDFRGMVDEVRIYDGVLSQAEIDAVYNDTHPCAGLTPNPEEFVLTTRRNASLSGLSFRDRDLVIYNPDDDSATLDSTPEASSGKTDANAIHYLDSGNIVYSFNGANRTDDSSGSSVTVTKADLLEFNPSNNNISFYLMGEYFDNDRDTASNIMRDIDALYIVDDDTIIISTQSAADILDSGGSTLLSMTAGDLVELTVDRNTHTVSAASMFFEAGVDYTYSGSGNPDITGFHIKDDGHYLINFGTNDFNSGDYVVAGYSVDNWNDVIEYDPSTSSAGLYFDGTKITPSSDSDIDGLSEYVAPPPSCTLGSFAITQPSYGLACPGARSEISITAMCDDGVTVKDDYAGTINLSSNESAASDFFSASAGGSAISSVTLNGSENGVVNVYLFHKNENADLRVTATDSSGSPSSQASSGTDYRTAGFRVSQEPGNFVCGGSTTLTLQAYGQTENGSGQDCEVLSGFTGNKNLKAWFDVAIDPDNPNTEDDSVSSSMGIGGTSINAHSEPATSNLVANFNQGEVELTLTYLDAGRILDINFIHDDSPYDGSVSGISALNGVSSAFVVSPDRMLVSVADPTAACATANLADCSVFKKTGENFDLSVSAVCSDVSDTVAASYEGDVTISHSLVAPSGGNLGSLLTSAATLTSGSQNVTQNVGEVGVFTFTVAPEIYFGVDQNSDSQSDITAGTSSNVGRFVPDDFTVGVIDNGTFDAFCDVSSGFSYIGQGVTYDALDLPTIAVTAVNHLGATTQNYTGDFMKLAVSEITRVFPTSDTSNSLAVTNSVASLTQVSELSGVITYGFNNADAYTYTKNAASEVIPFTSDLRVAVTGVNDGDVASTSVTPASPVWVAPDGVELRYGRWNMENVYGSELESLAMPARIEYLSSTGYVTNIDDACTGISQSGLTDINLSATPAGTHSAGAISDIAVDASTTDLAYNGTVLVGSGDFTFTAPGYEETGRVVINADLSNVPWLQHDWDGDGTYEDEEEATATFGQYRGNDRIIYWREVSP